MNKELTKIRYQGWLYAGVETELELAEAQYELSLELEAIKNGEQICYEEGYWQKKIKIYQHKLEIINERLDKLEAEYTRSSN
jgi:hypothetical protein